MVRKSYDEKGRPVYVASFNEFLGATDKIKTQIDFVGNSIESINTHDKNGVVTQIKNQFGYDHQNRLILHKQQINSQKWERIAENHYDELGKLIQKDVGGLVTATNALQEVDYKYNIRGWLKSINDIDASVSNDLFNFKINYDQLTAASENDVDKLYNRNIAETLWRTPNTDQSNVKAYSYNYDALNRLEAANFSEQGANNAFGLDQRYQEGINGYDKNGNIKGVFRTAGYDSNDFVRLWDNLSYTYQGNQLVSVEDNASTVAQGGYILALEEGFKDDTDVEVIADYIYDINGNMISDNNKNITSISYNHLNLPTQIVFDGGTMTTGDGSGNTQPTIVFEDDFSDGTVQSWMAYVGMAQPTIQSGSLRMQLVRGVSYPGAYTQVSLAAGHEHTITFDITDMPIGYQARLDITNTVGVEQHKYSINSNGQHELTFTPVNSGNHYISFMTNNKGNGSVEDYYYVYLDNVVVTDLAVDTDTTNTDGASGVITYMYDARGIKLKKTVEDDVQVLSRREYSGAYIYQDNNLTMISQPEGYMQPNFDGTFDYFYNYKDIWRNVRLTYADIDKDGTIEPSNEIVRELNYYPYGLVHKGYNNTIIGVENTNEQYQGQEFTEDLGLNTHEWKYRVSDPAIGRFWQIDPLAEKYAYNSTYAFQENKIGVGVELEGLEVSLWETQDNGFNYGKAIIDAGRETNKTATTTGKKTIWMGVGVDLEFGKTEEDKVKIGDVFFELQADTDTGGKIEGGVSINSDLVKGDISLNVDGEVSYTLDSPDPTDMDTSDDLVIETPGLVYFGVNLDEVGRLATDSKKFISNFFRALTEQYFGGKNQVPFIIK